MEYILIFISAIFVNNIVLSQFLGICPFLGVSKKVETAMGMSAAVAFVLTIATIVTLPDSEVCVGCFRIGILADNHFYPGHCWIGADGGNHSEESFSFFVSGVGCVLAADYNELLYSWCRYPGDSERLRPADRCCVRVFYGHRFRSGTGAFCRIARTDEPCESTERNARHSDCFDYRRFACYGIHGILRRGVRIYS